MLSFSRLAAPAALLIALSAPLAMAQTAPATLTVTGEGTVQTVPDMATLSIGVTTVGETAAAALAANSGSMKAVIDRMAAGGITGGDIQTSGLYVTPNWNGYDSSGAASITGYTAVNTVTVRIRALDQVGAVLDAALVDGANTLNGITFGLIDPVPTQDAARTAAVADAKRRAGVLIAATGGSLGRIVSVTEQLGYGTPAPMFRAEADSAAPPVEGGELGIMSSVTVTWEIVQ